MIRSASSPFLEARQQKKDVNSPVFLQKEYRNYSAVIPVFLLSCESKDVLSVNILRRMIKDGQIKGYRFGHKLYVTKEDVIRAVYGEDT